MSESAAEGRADQVSLRTEDFCPRHLGLQSGIIQIINLCHQGFSSLESTHSSGEVTKKGVGKRFDVWENKDVNCATSPSARNDSCCSSAVDRCLFSP